MPDRKKTRAERQAEVAYWENLAEQERFLRELQLRQAVVPRDWERMETLAPVEAPRTRVTLRVDDKTLRWFKALGPGWQRRVDKVLQAYVLGVTAREIDGPVGRDKAGEMI